MADCSRWPLYHIVDDASRRALLRARGPGDLPELPPDAGPVALPAWEPMAEIDRIIRRRPAGPERRSA